MNYITLLGCIVGFSVQQLVSKLNIGTNAPLPCIGNWIIIMSHFTGDINFTRNWIQYRNGFGDFAGSDFWLGNQKMYAVTSKPGMGYMLRVEV